VQEIDFITAFGRLLRDGNLRDAFAMNPEAVAAQVRLRPSDLPSWLQLAPADVEAQAVTLLRKRLDLVKYFAPETCRQPGEKLWPAFLGYSRANWPPEGCAKFFDAFQFCQHLKSLAPGTVATVEWNRLEFALSKRRMAIHYVRPPTAGKQPRRGIQFFVRGPRQSWREFFFYFAW
jgi:hypothetical protein